MLKSLDKLTDREYESYLSSDENMQKVMNMTNDLEAGTLQIVNIEYFKNNNIWELKEDGTYETTFYIFAIIPKQHKCLIADIENKVLKLGKEYTIGDYDMVLNIDIKKELVPLLENNIIKTSKEELL